MPTIKIHLEHEELDAIKRFANSLHVCPEDIAYAALHQMMLQAGDLDTVTEIKQTLDWRGNVLPAWSDSARSVHIYESKPDDEQQPSPVGSVRSIPPLVH
jgi:hypothetical protein